MNSKQIMLHIILFTILTTTVLLLGLVSMATGGKFSKKYSTTLMSLRVVFQAIAILSLSIAYLNAG